MLEFFAGHACLTRCMRYSGIHTASFDILFDGKKKERVEPYMSNSMDILSTSGFWFFGIIHHTGDRITRKYMIFLVPIGRLDFLYNRYITSYIMFFVDEKPCGGKSKRYTRPYIYVQLDSVFFK